MRSTVYDDAFYAAQADESLASARRVLPTLLATLRPGAVVDIGCGVGTWLAAAFEAGVTDGLGVDGAYVDPALLRIPRASFLADDLSAPGLALRVLGREGGAPAGRRFDLAFCLEVAEHLPFARASGLIADLCALADVVLFSAALPFQYGTAHVNEQWPEFWAILFRAEGYECFDCLRDGVWDDPAVAWWYAQNLLVFARAGSAGAAALGAPVGSRPLARVHPRCFLSGTLNLWHPHRAAARDEEPADYASLSAAWQSGAAVLPPLQAVLRAGADPTAPDCFPRTRTEVADPESLLAALQAERDQARVERDAARAERDAARAERDAAHTERDTAHAERDTAHAERDQARAERDAAHAERDTAHAERDTAHAERDQARAERDQAHAERDAAHSERDAARAAHDQVHAAHDQARSERDQASADLEAAHAERDSAHSALAALRAANATLEAANATLHRQSVLIQARFAELTRRARDGDQARAERDAMRAQRDALAALLDRLRASTSWRLTRPLRRLRGWQQD